MAPKSWEEYALKVASEGDAEAPARQQLYREQVNQCLDGMSQHSEQTVRDEMARGQLPRSV